MDPGYLVLANAQNGDSMKKPPTPKQVKAEVAKLRKMKPKVLSRSQFGDDHHEAIDAQIEVLEEGLENGEIYDRFEEGPENILTAALDAMGWMDGGSYGDGDKPSEDWKDLVR